MLSMAFCDGVAKKIFTFLIEKIKRGLKMEKITKKIYDRLTEKGDKDNGLGFYLTEIDKDGNFTHCEMRGFGRWLDDPIVGFCLTRKIDKDFHAVGGVGVHLFRIHAEFCEFWAELKEKNTKLTDEFLKLYKEPTPIQKFWWDGYKRLFKMEGKE